MNTKPPPIPFSVCLALGLLLLAAPAAVQAQFIYQTNADVITLVSYDGAGGAVTISNFVNSIGYEAFFQLSGVTSVSIPASVTNIEFAAFANCFDLTSLTVAASNSFYSSTVDGILFDKSQTTLLQCPSAIGSLNGFDYAIPGSVTTIAEWAFVGCFNLNTVTIGNSVTSIGIYAFWGTDLTGPVTIPASVTNIGYGAFEGSDSYGFGPTITVDTNNSFYSSVNGVLFDKRQTTLVEYPNGAVGTLIYDGGSYTIPSSVTSIGEEAFAETWLTNVTIPSSVTSIGSDAFNSCTILTSAYFMGNAPTADSTVFYGDPGTVYYLPGTIGWGGTFGSLTTALWSLPYPLILNNRPSLGFQSNRFGFIISWATNISVVVEACTNLASKVWTPLQTNALANGSFYFSEPVQASSHGRFYRISPP